MTATVGKAERRQPIPSLDRGSSSLKVAVFDVGTADEQLLIGGEVEAIGAPDTSLQIRALVKFDPRADDSRAANAVELLVDLLITVIASLVNIVSTFVAIALIGRIGRRPYFIMPPAKLACTAKPNASAGGASVVWTAQTPSSHGFHDSRRRRTAVCFD